MIRARSLSRRSFFASVTGSLLVGGGVSFSLSARAAAQRSEEAPDGTAPAGAGRRTPAYDSDKGAGSDNGNIGGARGAGRTRVRLCSDSDSGAGADPLGESRTKRTYTDTDQGPGADSVEDCPRPWYRW